MVNRRDFLKISAMAGAGLAASTLLTPRLFAFSQTTPLRKFLIGLPGLGPGGANEMGNYIPVLSPDTTTFRGSDLYRITMGQFTQHLHPDLPGPTKLWGYADAAHPDQKYLGGVIVANRNRAVRLNVKNNLPDVHPLPIDTSIMGADGAANRATVHLHGGMVPWTVDGGPHSWFTPTSTGPNNGAGPSFLNFGDQPGTANYYYPNSQSARLVWYHDHALGTTRLNAYSGLASAYIIRDDYENLLIKANIIPSREVPLIIQDKNFFAGDDPNYIWGQPGELWYPYQYEAELLAGQNPLPPVSCVPEFFSDTILVNGAPYPYLKVEQRRYRFRILNGSQSRFYNLQLYYADASGQEADLSKSGPAFVQFGSEGGFLPAPVLLNSPAFPTPLLAPDTADPAGPFNLMLAPAERADIIIDFSRVPAGSKLILYSDPPGPFPAGDPANDYQISGSSPNTRTLMQFQVIPRVGAPDPLNFQATFAALKLALAPFAFDKLKPSHAVRTRDLTLNEDFDDFGRLIQRLGTTVPNGLNNEGNVTYSRNYEDRPTEVVNRGDVEIWRIFNNTGDTHPIHFHLVNVQVLYRAPFVVNAPGDFAVVGPHRPPDANESGWKETVRMNPGEVTAVIMKFDLPNVPFAVPDSPRLKKEYDIKGAEYVWHCHILEHEEHDMMRPLVVKS